MPIQEQLQQDLKTAMRAGEKQRVEVIRMTIAALKNARIAQLKQEYDAGVAAAGEDAQVELDRSGGLSDEAALDVLGKEAKRRREAALIYRQANREDLASNEEAEAVILEAYLPRQMTAEELRPLLEAKIAEVGASGPGDIGKVMPVVMKEFKGKADGRVINQVVREILGAK